MAFYFSYQILRVRNSSPATHLQYRNLQHLLWLLFTRSPKPDEKGQLFRVPCLPLHPLRSLEALQLIFRVRGLFAVISMLPTENFSVNPVYFSPAALVFLLIPYSRIPSTLGLSTSKTVTNPLFSVTKRTWCGVPYFPVSRTICFLARVCTRIFLGYARLNFPRLFCTFGSFLVPPSGEHNVASP